MSVSHIAGGVKGVASARASFEFQKKKKMKRRVWTKSRLHSCK